MLWVHEKYVGWTIPSETGQARRRYGEWLALGLSLLLLSCASLSTNEREAEARFKVGVSHLMAGNIQAAYLKFHEALELDPDNKEIYNALGNVHIQLDEIDKAEEYFGEAVDIDDGYSEAYNNLCYIHYIRKEYAKAERDCKKALENPLYPTPEKAFYNLGRTFYAQESYDKAIEAFKNAEKRYPNFVQAYYGMALAYNADGMYGKAAEAIGRAITFDPRFLGDREKAVKEFKKMRNSSPTPSDFDNYIEILHY